MKRLVLSRWNPFCALVIRYFTKSGMTFTRFNMTAHFSFRFEIRDDAIKILRDDKCRQVLLCLLSKGKRGGGNICTHL